jgi:hypothetical protein
MTQTPVRTAILHLFAMTLLCAPAAFAQENTDTGQGDVPEMERPIRDRISNDDLKDEISEIEVVTISRDIDTLPSEIEPQPEDPDLADTALVFTNMDRRSAGVICVGFNKNGRAVGRTATRIPPLGLRYVLASDISNGVDFIGQVQCSPRGNVVGSVVFIGPAVTDLPVRNGKLGKSRIRFPLVAHY